MKIPSKKTAILKILQINKPIRQIKTISPENHHKIKLTQIHKQRMKQILTIILIINCSTTFEKKFRN